MCNQNLASSHGKRQGKVLMFDHLQKRGFTLANKSYLCLKCEECVDHLLLLFAKLISLWELLFSLFGIA